MQNAVLTAEEEAAYVNLAAAAAQLRAAQAKAVKRQAGTKADTDTEGEGAADAS